MLIPSLIVGKRSGAHFLKYATIFFTFLSLFPSSRSTGPTASIRPSPTTDRQPPCSSLSTSAGPSSGIKRHGHPCTHARPPITHSPENSKLLITVSEAREKCSVKEQQDASPPTRAKGGVPSHSPSRGPASLLGTRQHNSRALRTLTNTDNPPEH